MPTLGSSVLFVGVHDKVSLALEVEQTARIDQIPKFKQAEVLVLPARLAQSELFKETFFQQNQAKKFQLLVILADSEIELELLEMLIQTYPIFRILSGANDPALEMCLLEAIERIQLKKQDEQMKLLIHEQTEKLKNLQHQLEARVLKRTKFLEESRLKSLRAQTRWESIRQATVLIHQSTSTTEMEQRLLQKISESVPLEILRIFIGSNEQMNLLTQKSSIYVNHKVTLFDAQENSIGTLVLFRKSPQTFSAEEKDFFQLLGETLSPALQRLNSLRTRESFKEEWEATFNAVADSVVILNSKYEILQVNSAFHKQAMSAENMVGMKCYQALFHRESPCNNCKLGESFRLEGRRETYDVSGQVVLLSPDEDSVFVHQYHDVTEQVRMERRILDSARLAELGTIGSSIAHELNNPLGGILSYVQLVKMDLKVDDPLRTDIEEMEKGVLRCRDIVQNLLNFTRSPGQEQKSRIDFREVIRRALGILILKTRSQGIDVKTNLPEAEVLIEGHFNQLTQAIQNVLQSALSSIQEKLITNKGFQPILEIILQTTPQEIILSVLDNGRGPDSAPSLDIPLAQRILIEHGASLEISFQQKALRVAKISFARPVFAP